MPDLPVNGNGIDAYSPAEVAARVENVGVTKANMPLYRMAALSVLAGAYLHAGRFSRGLGRFSPVAFRPSAELPDAQFPLIFTTGRSLYHYHSGSMSRLAG